MEPIPLHQIVLHKYGDGEGWHGLNRHKRSADRELDLNIRWVDRATGEAPVPGDVFFHRPFAFRPPGRPSEHFCQARRLPLVVVLPGDTWFSPDFIYAEGDPGWVVSDIIKFGTAWKLKGMTIWPMIEVEGSFRGWVKQGYIRHE